MAEPGFSISDEVIPRTRQEIIELEGQLQPRCVIINADDFGMSAGVNLGILEAHRCGIVTSASLMVRWAAAEEAAALSRQCAELSVGLHVDLAEWAVQDGQWIALYEVVDCDDPAMVRREVESQLNLFRKLMGRDPTHLDSHQHVHRQEPLRSLMLELARDLSVPLRHFSDDIRYCGAFYGQTAKGEPLPESISADSLIDVLKSLGPGVTEVGCHPGFDDDLNTMYRRERRQEVLTLCDERVRRVIEAEGLQLHSFNNLPKSKSACRNTSTAAPEGAVACER